jgi:hypothetical protein
MATIQDLLAYASRHATIRQQDYFDPRYARADEVRAWRNDKNKRDRQRLAVLRSWPGRCRSTEPLVPGTYWGTRLEVTASGEIDFTACQYPGLEVWLAVADYFQRTKALEG